MATKEGGAELGRAETDAGIMSSHGISLDLPASERPPLVSHLSAPTYSSPLRHRKHTRQHSRHRDVKETLNARSEYKNNEDDGRAEHSVNQYIIKEEIGRGSFGAVHIAVDQYGQDFAIKEFSKSRLRKRAQSMILRKPYSARRRGHLSAAGGDLNSPLHQHSASDVKEGLARNPLYLIEEEIAIMKKLNHPNLVNLIEVLDDPDEDSLYMVLQMCKKGVIMKVGLDEVADPYDEESCRCWFRDMILGIEYLHAQGVVHRDIKPDNLLLMEDDVLKIVDFGVSEMFEKESDMKTAKSAGSPAFLPPELCVAKHGDISGKAADIWSMGVSLYCLMFGHIPFERAGVLEMYEAIKIDKLEYPSDTNPNFVDLMVKILEKDPEKRIQMPELREHPWVTKDGTDPMMSAEENTKYLVDPPTEAEMNRAITSNMTNLLAVVKAVKKFKTLLTKKRPQLMNSILHSDERVVSPPAKIRHEDSAIMSKSKSVDIDDRKAIARVLVSEGLHAKSDTSEQTNDSIRRMDSAVTITPALYKAQHDAHHIGEKITPTRSHSDHEQVGERGHAHDPMDEEPLWLGIGVGNEKGGLAPPDMEIVAESPTAAGFNIYDTAYQNEVERIRSAQGETATVYLTRRVDSKKVYKMDENMIDVPAKEDIAGKPHEGWKGVLDAAREKEHEMKTEAPEKESRAERGKGKLRGLASYAKTKGSNVLAKGQELFSSGTKSSKEGSENVERRKGSDTESDTAAEGVESGVETGRKEGSLTDRGGIALANVLHDAMEKRKKNQESEGGSAS